MMHIEKLDPTKTRKDVTRRAAMIRERLISEGVYDLDKLPHVNFNVTLGKRLKTLRDSGIKEK
jgi:hypothetical protein